MKVQFSGATDVGLKRDHNEDSFFLMAEQNLYMVADGMGGHSSGEVASRIAVETVAKFFADSDADEDLTWPYRMDKGISYEENRLASTRLPPRERRGWAQRSSPVSLWMAVL